MPGQRDVRVGVGDAGEDRVILEQPLEAAEIDLRREREQHGRRTAIDTPRSGDARLSRGAAEQRACRRRYGEERPRRRNTMTASVVSQPAISCQAGSVNR